ncbi:DUF2975 domain-containing protein [Bacteroides sp. 214]|uniref:DUF2975 domain-containing protein n=1 Tax=Bacteroides sp. 214 TaxID=2302935 RepID=UPI0013D87A51|nr:DUF2975 domain-containing protein [Bacteroides sp. 214]NDW13077.1 DUF2975 domain-containing protein [Bacteroides sp. 214]
MKKRLNILCVLIFLVLGYSTYQSGYSSGRALRLGMDIGKTKNKELLQRVYNMHSVGLMPKSEHFLADSVYNEKTDTYLPASYSLLAVSIDANAGSGYPIMLVIFSLLSFIAMVTAIIFFILLVVSVNRSDIFTWKNISRIRWVGYMLILYFVSNLVPILLTETLLKGVLSIKGYMLDFSELITTTSLILGIASLIIAEVFAVGLKMKEDQELTI